MKKRFVMAALLTVAMPTAAMANRMTGGGFNLPDKPGPEPEPAPPVVEPAPPPPSPPTYTPPPAPEPAPPVYNPPPPTYHPPAPQPQPPQYGVFRPYGPLPDGRVHVSIDNSFEFGTIHGYQIAVQDNGPNANDQMVIQGPNGTDDVWIDCHVGEEWASYGPNSEEFVHSIVTTYCGW